MGFCANVMAALHVTAQLTASSLKETLCEVESCFVNTKRGTPACCDVSYFFFKIPEQKHKETHTHIYTVSQLSLSLYLYIPGIFGGSCALKNTRITER